MTTKTTKTTDSKGRLALGARYANATFIVQEVDENEIRIIAAKVIPQSEAWLFENTKHLEAVERGLDQARAGMLSTNPPNLKEDGELLAELED